MKINFSPPDITELEINEVVEALKSGWITTGPRTKELERRIAIYLGTPKAVCLNSATAALEMILRILGIGPGDEVITSAYSYTASASPVVHVGAKLVLVDTAPDSYEMDYDKVAAAITDKTKAIIPVDIGGVPCNYDRLFTIVNNAKFLFIPSNDIQRTLGRIPIVADCAHSFGATYKGQHTGDIADFSSFSFHAVKILLLLRAVVLRGNLYLVLMMKFCINNSNCYLFMVRIKMRWPKLRWGPGNTILKVPIINVI